MFMIFVLLLQLIIWLNGMFPSFGLHLLTLKKAKNDLLIMLFFILILLIGFTTWVHIISGSFNDNFHQYHLALLFLFHYVDF